MTRACIIYISLVVMIIFCVYSQFNKRYTYNENTELHSFSMLMDVDHLTCDDESTLLEQMERVYERRVGYKGSDKFEYKFGPSLSKKTVQSEMLNILIHFHKACEMHDEGKNVYKPYRVVLCIAVYSVKAFK